MPQFHRRTAEPAEPPTVGSTVQKCQRCNGYHQDLQFRRFAAGPMRTPAGDTFDYWALCPTNGEPLLARATEGGHGTTDG